MSEDFEVTCGSHPVQIEGRLTDGRWFYFRARGPYAQLGSSSIDASEAVAATIGDRAGGSVGIASADPRKYNLITIPEAHRLLIALAAVLPDRED